MADDPLGKKWATANDRVTCQVEINGVTSHAAVSVTTKPHSPFASRELMH